MQLERLAVQLRLRNPWEAIDLGFAMTRAWMREVYGAWFAVFVPVCALALLLLPPQWATLLVWWLKPVLDRVVLHVFSNAVFGGLPRVRDTLRALPRALTPGLLASLTWYRFFLARSFNLPVWQLERQRGSAARARRRQLHRRVGSYAVWLTVACMHFELVLGLSLVALYDLLIPAAADSDFGLFQLFYGSDAQRARWIVAFAYFGVITLLEPAYVAGGFALYLNRRTALEGWDLEVALRRIGERARPQQRSPAPPAPEGIAASLLAAALAGVLALAAPQPGRAQETSAPPPGQTTPGQATPEQSMPAQPAPAQATSAQATPGSSLSTNETAQLTPAQAIKEVLKRPEFDEYRERTSLEYLGKQAEPERKRKPPRDWSGWAIVLDALAQILRILAWAAVGVALVFLAYFLLRNLGFLGAAGRSEYTPPQTLFGLDVRPESLPEDLAAEAARLARAGELAKALSLLYRGALASLLHRDGVELAGGDTEADCLRKSQPRLAAATHSYFARLLLAWQHLAYARRRVPVEEVEALCAAWPVHFEVAAA